MGLNTGIAKRLQTGAADVIPMPTASPADNQVLVYLAGEFVWQGMVGGGDMLAANNLSELTDRAAARSNLDLEPGIDVMAWDADLAAMAALSTAPFGRSLLEQVSDSAVRTLIGAGTSNFDGAFSSLSGLPTTLAGYGITDAAALVHVHIIDDVTGLQAVLDSKASSSHTHAQSDITNLVSDLAGKAAASHTHAQSEITDLVADLALKADLVGGVLPTSQLPSLAIADFLGEVADQTAMLALTGQRGDWCYRTDTSTDWQLIADDASLIGNWRQRQAPGSNVISVNSQTGVVVLSYTDVGAAAASHTHIIDDTTGLQAALDGKQAAAAGLTSIAAASTVGSLYYLSAAGTWSAVTVGTGLDFTGGTLTATGGGGGAIDISGTPAATQVMLWVDADTAEGSSKFTFNTATATIRWEQLAGTYQCHSDGRYLYVGTSTGATTTGLRLNTDTGSKVANVAMNGVTDGLLALHGAAASNTYGCIQLFGQTHATFPSAIRFLTNNGQRGLIDVNGLWNIQGDVEVRDGTTPLDFSVFKTYTSGSSYERVAIDTVSSATENRIYSESGSVGGTYRDLVIGASPNAAFVEVLRIDSSGDVTLDRASGLDAGAPAAGDLVLILDVSDGNKLKVVQASTLGGGGGGTVTSVAVSGSDGIEVDSGSPVTSSGTIALGVNKAGMLSHLTLDAGALLGTFGDNVNVIQDGAKAFVQVKRACTITGWRVAETGGVSSTIAFDIWRDIDANFPPTVADSIVGTTAPTLTAQSTNTGTDMTGWSTSCNAGDWIVFVVDGAPTAALHAIIKLDVTWT